MFLECLNSRSSETESLVAIAHIRITWTPFHVLVSPALYGEPAAAPAPTRSYPPFPAALAAPAHTRRFPQRLPLIPAISRSGSRPYPTLPAAGDPSRPPYNTDCKRCFDPLLNCNWKHREQAAYSKLLLAGYSQISKMASGTSVFRVSFCPRTVLSTLYSMIDACTAG